MKSIVKLIQNNENLKFTRKVSTFVATVDEKND